MGGYIHPKIYDYLVMSLAKSVLTNYTSMSLDERFTQLRRADTRLLVRGLTDLRQYASMKSRRLALQMSRRPSVIAALTTNMRNFGGISRRGQLGRGGRGGIRNFSIGRRGNGSFRGTNRLRRSSSVGQLPRSQSLQSLNSRSASPFRTRGRRGGRGGRGIMGRNNTTINTAGNSLRGRGRGLGGQGRGGLNQKRADNFSPRRGRGGFTPNSRGAFTSTSRGRGRSGLRRGGGSVRGARRGGQQQRQAPPSKEKLDMELDEYMASSRAILDKEIDTYMSQTQEKWEWHETD